MNAGRRCAPWTCSARTSSLAWACVLGTATAAVAPPEPAGEFVYVVQRGDTLIALQQQLLRPDLNWRALQKLGRVADPRRLQPGTRLAIPLAWLRDQATTAEVLHVHGQAWLDRPGAPRQPLQAANELRSGDRIQTEAQSSVSVRFADGSRSLIGPVSVVQLEQLARTGPAGPLNSTLRLDSGQIDTRVTPGRPAPRFELRTPVVNLGVRGTDFRARVDDTRTLAEVLQGRVAVGPQPVDAGFGVSANARGVSPPQALSAAPDLSATPELVERLPLQLPLPQTAPSGGARAVYRAQVFDASQPDLLVLDGVFDTAQADWLQSPPDGRYELRLRQRDAQGIEGLDARRLFTLKARPEPPFALQPRAGAKLLDDAVTLAWSRHPQAGSYRVQVATNPGFEPLHAGRDGLVATELTLSLAAGRWHWRVASVRADGDTGPWGDAQTFEREERPPPPPPPSAPPALPPRPVADGVMLSWSASPLAGVQYQVQVARDSAFATPLLDETTPSTELLLARPPPGTYWVRVRAVGADGRAGSFGAAQVVDVPRPWPWWWLLLPLLLL
jgi:hypothetical protein